MSLRVRAASADAAAVLLFVILGRNTHDEGNAVTGTLSVAAPFLIALALGWVIAMRTAGRETDVRFGATVWAVTLVAGMLLRHFAFDRGTATPFVIVATLFLAAALIGWRAVARVVARRVTRTR